MNCEEEMTDTNQRRQVTVMGRLKQKPILKKDKNDKQNALLEIAVDEFGQDTGAQLPTEWYNVHAYGEVTPARIAAQYDKGQSESPRV
jgi:single-stranded DNA-binding protein